LLIYLATLNQAGLPAHKQFIKENLRLKKLTLKKFKQIYVTRYYHHRLYRWPRIMAQIHRIFRRKICANLMNPWKEGEIIGRDKYKNKV